MTHLEQLTRGHVPARQAAGASRPLAPVFSDAVRDHFLLRGSRVLLHLFTRGCMRWYHQLRVDGRKHFLNARPCIIAPNHSSHLDTLAIFSSLPVSQMNATCSVAAKDYFFSNAVLGLVARLMANGIPIDRCGRAGGGLRLCAKKLDAGNSLIIFPEGTRTRTGRIGSFKPGVVALGRQMRVPVIPTYIRGTLESLGWAKYFPRRERITVIFGEPMRFWEGELGGLCSCEAARRLEDRVRTMQQDLERRSGGR